MISDGLAKPNPFTNRKSRGRGTSKEESLKEQRARDFFVMCMDVEFTWKQPGTPGRQKCYSLFKKWTLELLENYHANANERQIIGKQKLSLSFRRLLFKLEYQLNKFLNLTEDHRNNWKIQAKKAELIGIEPPAPYEPRMEWEYFIRKLITDIAEIRDHLATTDYALTIHEGSEEEIIRYLEELQVRRYKIEKDHREKVELIKTRLNPPTPS